MRLALCIKKDLIGNLFLNRLLPALAGCQIQVFLCDRVDGAERAASQATDFVFYERDLPVEHLFPALDRAPPGDDRPGRQYSFNQLAARHDCPIETWGNINRQPALQALAAFDPDIIASVRYNYILQQAVIDLARRAVVNVHPGLLPHFAGVYPSFRALQHNAAEFGASLHYIRDRRIDHGPLIGTQRAATRPERSVLWHIREAYLMGAALLLQFLRQAETAALPSGEPQDHRQRQYHGYPSQEEFHELHERGIDLINHHEYLQWLAEYAPDD